jgi:hypothetical protein
MAENKQKKDSLDIKQEYVIALQCHEPKHYERIPDILDHLTYIDERLDIDTGKIVYARKRLSPIEKELYRVIKKFAGKTTCWAKTETLAELVNCSVGAVVKAKRVLMSAFEQLDAKPLIYVEHRMIPTEKDNKKINKKANHVITITHIWNYNNAHMVQGNEFWKKYYKLGDLTDKEAELALESLRQPSIVHNSGAHSPDERACEAHSPDERAYRGARSPGEVNHTPYNHTPDGVSYKPTEVGVNAPLSRNEMGKLLGKYGFYEKERSKILQDYSLEYLNGKVQLLEYYTKTGKSFRNPGNWLDWYSNFKSRF